MEDLLMTEEFWAIVVVIALLAILIAIVLAYYVKYTKAQQQKPKNKAIKAYFDRKQAS